MVSLERVAIAFTGACCIYYGILGVSTICTSRSCDKAFVSGESGQQVKLTPAIATFYCSMAIIIGIIIVKIRHPASAVIEGITTIGSGVKAQSAPAFELRAFSNRFWVLLVASFLIVIVLMRNVLLKPLDSCEAVQPEEAPFMFALRSTLKKMEFWFVGLGFITLALGILFSKLETYYEEGYAKRQAQDEQNLEDYGVIAGAKDRYEKAKRQFTAAKQFFKPAGDSQGGGQPITSHLAATQAQVQSGHQANAPQHPATDPHGHGKVFQHGVDGGSIASHQLHPGGTGHVQSLPEKQVHTPQPSASSSHYPSSSQHPSPHAHAPAGGSHSTGYDQSNFDSVKSLLPAHVGQKHGTGVLY